MSNSQSGLLASFDHLDTTVAAIKKLREAGIQGITAYAPFPEHHIEEALGYKESPVRIFTLVGGLTGAATGFAFTIFSVQDWPLMVGGKPLLSIPAFKGFEVGAGFEAARRRGSAVHDEIVPAAGGRVGPRSTRMPQPPCRLKTDG